MKTMLFYEGLRDSVATNLPRRTNGQHGCNGVEGRLHADAACFVSPISFRFNIYLNWGTRGSCVAVQSIDDSVSGRSTHHSANRSRGRGEADPTSAFTSGTLEAISKKSVSKSLDTSISQFNFSFLEFPIQIPSPLATLQLLYPSCALVAI